MSSTEITQILKNWKDGDRDALDRLIPIVYAELRRIAAFYLRRERADHTLQPTALVNEAYLKLIHGNRINWQNRAHFFAVAARMMRQILVNHAEAHRAKKRGGNIRNITLTDNNLFSPQESVDLVALDRALKKLTAMDQRKSQIVELHFLAALRTKR